MIWSAKETPVVRRVLKALRERARAHDDTVPAEYALVPLVEELALEWELALDVKREFVAGTNKRRSRVFGVKHRGEAKGTRGPVLPPAKGKVR